MYRKLVYRTPRENLENALSVYIYRYNIRRRPHHAASILFVFLSLLASAAARRLAEVYRYVQFIGFARLSLRRVLFGLFCFSIREDAVMMKTGFFSRK